MILAEEIPFTDLNQNIKTTLTDIQKQINNFPGHLHGMLPKIEDALSSKPSFQAHQQSMPAKIDDVSLPPNITTFEPAVYRYIKTWFNNLVNRLKDELCIGGNLFAQTF